MRKKNFLVVFFILLFSLLAIGNIWHYYIQEQTKITNQFVGENAIYFRVNGGEKKSVITDFYQSAEDVIFFNELGKTPQYTIIAIMYKGDVELPQTRQQQFLIPAHLLSTESKAVIGSNIDTGTVPFLVQNNTKIVDYLHYKENQALDNCIFINIGSVSDLLTPIFILDGQDPETISAAYQKISQLYSLTTLETPKDPLNRIVKLNQQQQQMSGWSLAFATLSLVLLSLFCFSIFQKEVEVKRLIGAKVKDIYLPIYLHICTHAIIAAAVTSICLGILSKNSFLVKLDFNWTTISAQYIIFIAALLGLVTINVAKKLQIN